jgi:hypothetical protein
MDLPIHFELVWLVMIIQRILSHLRIKWRSSSLQMVKTLLRQKSIRRYQNMWRGGKRYSLSFEIYMVVL